MTKLEDCMQAAQKAYTTRPDSALRCAPMPYSQCERVVRAVIACLMDVTPGMVVPAEAAYTLNDPAVEYYQSGMIAAWQAMLQHVLDEGDK